WQSVEPFDLPEEIRRLPAEEVFLPLPEVGRHLEDPVAIQLRKILEKIRCKGTAARTKFEDIVRSQCLQNRRALARQDPGKQRGAFRRGNEVAGRAEPGRSCAVIAEPWRVQGELHELAEADTAARLPYRFANERRDALAVSKALG